MNRRTRTGVAAVLLLLLLFLVAAGVGAYYCLRSSSLAPGGSQCNHGLKKKPPEKIRAKPKKSSRALLLVTLK
jgi:hypothetical protein